MPTIDTLWGKGREGERGGKEKGGRVERRGGGGIYSNAILSVSFLLAQSVETERERARRVGGTPDRPCSPTCIFATHPVIPY